MASLWNLSRWSLRLDALGNRARFAWLRHRLAGRVDFGPGCEVWAENLLYRGRGRAVFGPGCAVDRNPFPSLLDIEEDGLVQLRDECWLRGKYRPNVLTCFEHARITIGPGSILNGVIISARDAVTIGERAMLSWDVTITDCNLHPLANGDPIAVRPLTIGDHVWIGAGAFLLPGASIGAHSVIGARSVVLSPIPDHVLAAGNPARVIRQLGDRDHC